MSGGRKTKRITFNLKDRGRVHTGQSRNDVDIQTWIDAINSPKTQEVIATGGMLGYYGHQVRILFGLQVPETVIVGDKQISISPATRTIEMTCDQDGNVTHRQEFLDTPEGEHALQKYRAKIGGFSAVNDFKRINGTVFVTDALGFDYVLQPNYVTNMGDGELLLDSVHGDIVRANAEASMVEMYDSIHSGNHMRMLLDSATMQSADLENRLLEVQAEKLKRQELQQQQHDKMLDSALCPTLDINEYMAQGKRFMDCAVVTDIEPKKENPVKSGGAGGWFGGLFG